MTHAVLRRCVVLTCVSATCLAAFGATQLAGVARRQLRSSPSPPRSMDDEWNAIIADLLRRLSLISALGADARHVQTAAQTISDATRSVRVFIPLLHALIGLTTFMSALVASDRLYHAYVALFIRHVAKRKPEDAFPHAPFPDDVVLHAAEFPFVCVQLPMFNESECATAVIAAACELSWPRERLLVQVLDDSTDQTSQERAQDAVASWRERGVNITYRWRSNRTGFKAGAMAEAMPEIRGYEFIAIFDADFHPDSDFLLRTVPYLVHNADVGFVQTRWVYANQFTSVLTVVQAISLNYHFACEQFARVATGSFLNFNGTAGVWRRSCIEQAGGWLARTTVEDMDLSLRAYCQGWRFVYLHDVTCLNELPSSYEAYRKQQHRWSCGPMQLWRKAASTVWASPLHWGQKLYINLYFFGSRLFAAHIVSFFFYCTLIPLSVLIDGVRIPFWALVYCPLVITASTVIFTPGGWTHSVAFVLFENAMCAVKLRAMLSGLFELSDAHEWVVTQKLGGWAKKAQGGLAAAVHKLVPRPPAAIARRQYYFTELAVAALFLSAGVSSIVSQRLGYAVFLLLQGATCASFGLSLWVDTQRRSCV